MTFAGEMREKVATIVTVRSIISSDRGEATRVRDRGCSKFTKSKIQNSRQYSSANGLVGAMVGAERRPGGLKISIFDANDCQLFEEYPRHTRSWNVAFRAFRDMYCERAWKGRKVRALTCFSIKGNARGSSLAMIQSPTLEYLVCKPSLRSQFVGRPS